MSFISITFQTAIIDPSESIKSRLNAIDYGLLFLEYCPPSQCLGRDCLIIPARHNSCLFCACPLDSRAVGCDYMPDFLQVELAFQKCPNKRKPRFMPRWFRKVKYYNPFCIIR